MVNYTSPVSTNDDLINKLDDKLSNKFEENIVNAFGRYITDERLDGYDYARIAQFYEEARNAYLEASAAIIMYPEALDYLD